jgi:hypothetical protein
MNENSLVQQQAVWDCLRWFEQTPRTEVEFRARMKELPQEDLTLLRAFYGVADDCDLLDVVCRFWDVRTLRSRAG